MERAEQVCRKTGTRLTPNRKEVLGILSESHGSLGAYDILERMEGPSSRRPAPAAVYRALEFLIGVGLVHRLGVRNTFFACTQPGHGDRTQFWICRGCGIVGETESEQIAKTIPDLAKGLGFLPESVHVEIEGVCGTCRAEQGVGR